MQKDLTAFLHEAAESLRDLALRAPDIANELRRYSQTIWSGRRSSDAVTAPLKTMRQIEIG